VQPISQLRLPQCLLGGEAQLLAFVAANPELAERLFFAPMPEMFFTPESLRALWAATGVEADGMGVHLRFGGTRNARVLKDMRNGMVLAEDHVAPPITASRHPFASGLTLPVHMRRVLAYDRRVARPQAIGGSVLPLSRLGPETVAADLGRRMRGSGGNGARGRGLAADGLEIVSLAEFHSGAWAAGPVRAVSAHLRAAAAAKDGAPFVLVPWNLNHPGSAVPALVERTLSLQSVGRPAVRLLLMPYNYPGQTGLIRRVVRQVRKMDDAAEALAGVFVGRVSELSALGTLRRLARVAWVDGNDPEFDWTARRLAACGVAPVLLAAGEDRLGRDMARVAADDALTITTDTRFGLLHFRTALPSLRALRHLLPVTREMGAPARPQAPRGGELAG
jgi:hypothetical protein